MDTVKILLDEIQSNIEKIFAELKFPSVSFVIEPSKPNFGDVTCNAPFLLAKHLKKKPYDIAKIMSEKYEKFQEGLVKKVEAHPSGYLNFFVDSQNLIKLY